MLDLQLAAFPSLCVSLSPMITLACYHHTVDNIPVTMPNLHMPGIQIAFETIPLSPKLSSGEKEQVFTEIRRTGSPYAKCCGDLILAFLSVQSE